MCGSSDIGDSACDHPRPARAAQRDHRRDVRRARRCGRGGGGRRCDPRDHHQRRRPGLRRGQRSCRLPRRVPRGDEEIPVWRLLRALATCETPIVAAVHGNCVGIGTTMLLHCDLVIADDSARFSMPFVDLGLVPEAASSLLFPRLAGRRRAARYLLLAEPFGVEEALAIGLVSHRAATGRGRQAPGVVDGVARQAARSAAADPAAAAPWGARRSARANEDGEQPVCRTPGLG